MASATFYDPAKSEEGNLSLTTSYQTIETGQTGSATDLVVLVMTNESSNASTVTFADNAGNIIGVVGLPASAGQSESNPAINLLKPNPYMMGLELNYANAFVYHLPATKVLQAKVNSVTGGARRIFWKSKTF